ncbi:hypothetical protein FBY51_0540 [Zymomonas mobilis]|uniref:Uncharacterized protein n=1 Tax=Zymomonas mobilis subsp. mobilis (strain ATCC 10988 / DSM 424 / LMG 404 / NCIMB 8938 / NRRL B-806 / ZM1) TaxID=555217 RepID=A0A0H3FYJ3_ZYMMA|nr:conserved hypothetical protein [Zymomonas mobilis subsp. mobilis ATCC 10988]AFN56759.1 hypothetical protein ZZ6_0866 [Zymomonas mobilis subsp. mobilis ATCC 29191]TQK77810.1 hypothetical protein FBY53_0450 [Zymomonas mobilis]TQL15544.1 hypothetical protein FBY51_0540 [Zymomonas mobilis]TQL27635.1 hypothetical protein FBY55_0961 [Zymomonas mobilis]
MILFIFTENAGNFGRNISVFFVHGSNADTSAARESDDIV